MSSLHMELLAEWNYDPVPIHRGYTGKFLSVDLGDGNGAFGHSVHDVDEAMIDTYTGGRPCTADCA